MSRLESCYFGIRLQEYLMSELLFVSNLSSITITVFLYVCILVHVSCRYVIQDSVYERLFVLIFVFSSTNTYISIFVRLKYRPLYLFLSACM